MWTNNSLANRPNSCFTFMEGPLSILIDLRPDGHFYAKCNLFDIANRKLEAKDAFRAKIEAAQLVQKKAADICNICNEAIAVATP